MKCYERQGIDQIPTVHLGVAASQMEKRGIRTERGNINREIEISNQKLRQLKARIVKLQNWIKEETENTNVITGILSRREQTGQRSHYSAINNLKAAASMLNFLTANDIKDMAGLDKKMQSMIEKQFSIREELKPIDRRLKTLDKHIEQAEYYLEFKPFNQQRRQMKPNHQKDYTEAHRRELTLYEAAERYLGGVMNGKTGLPIQSWKSERDKLNTDRQRLNGEYISLKNDTTEVEKIRRNVYDIVREEQRREQPTRKQDMEL